MSGKIILIRSRRMGTMLGMMFASAMRFRGTFEERLAKSYLHLMEFDMLLHFAQGHLLLALFQRATGVLEEGSIVRAVVSVRMFIKSNVWSGRCRPSWQRWRIIVWW
jgi:hypothetical protein